MKPTNKYCILCGIELPYQKDKIIIRNVCKSCITKNKLITVKDK